MVPAHYDHIDWKRIFSLSSIAFTIGGVVCAVVALKGFMLPNHFIDGGITGISILISKGLHIDISLLLIGLNIPFVIIGYQRIGKSFAVQTTITILLTEGLQAYPFSFLKVSICYDPFTHGLG